MTEILQKRIEQLELENAMLRRDFHHLPQGNSVVVPDELKPLFDLAQQTVGSYFRDLKMDPSKGTIEIHDQRYVLVRASTLSKDFLDTVQKLYADRGVAEAFSIGKNMLFDISHVIGMNDARNFHNKMNLTDPIAKLSAGPVHFAYSGWAFVEILPESHPSPDDDFLLVYNHPYSFEADSWKRAGKVADSPVCIMNTGYSSGWCEESFGLPLTAVEVTCTAKGDERCTFIMSPPHKIQEHIDRYHHQSHGAFKKQEQYEIPTFFERKKVEEEMRKSKLLAEESAKTKSDFVANMSHELRTPLSVILGFSDLLSRTGLSFDQSEYLKAIHSAGEHLLNVINDILDLSKLDAGKFSLAKTTFRIPELMHAMQIMFAGKAMDKQLALECHADVALHHAVIGDQQRLSQILMNLIGNAIKFTETGSVEVSCKVGQQNGPDIVLQFTVTDTGIGIADDKLATVFERFSQADNDITRKYGGTGLGLAIARQLVELLGGDLNVQSEPGKGTQFAFSLPFQYAADDVAEDVPKAAKEKQAYVSQSVLVVEDSIMNQRLTQIMLHQNGFKVTIAANGAEAVSLLKEQTFDLILMDIQMPVMDGCQAAYMIRNELNITTPIIAMTAHALEGEREKCIREGMDDYLAKPFREEELLKVIAKWPARSKAQQQQESPKPLISLSFLREQTNNNTGFIREMIDLFSKQVPDDIMIMTGHINRADYKGIYKTAHAMRNAVGFFGLLPATGPALLHIEALANKGQGLDEIKACFEQVRIVCEQAVEELNMIDDQALK